MGRLFFSESRAGNTVAYNLIDLKLIVAIADSGSLTRAAAKLAMAPSSASHRLSHLESTWHVALFARHARGLSPTTAGQAVARHARQLFAQLGQLEVDLVHCSSGTIGNVAVMANAYASNCFLPGYLAGFADDYPDVRVTIEEHSSPEIIRAIQAGVAEIGIASMESFPEEIATFLYGIEHLAVITPKGHPLASTECLTLNKILTEPFVCMSGGSEIHTLAMNLAVAHGATLDIRIQVQSFDAVCRMVAAGMGIGMVPHDWVLLNAAQGSLELEVLPIAEEWAKQPIYLCHHRERPMTVAAEAMLEHLIAGGFPRKCGAWPAGFVP